MYGNPLQKPIYEDSNVRKLGTNVRKLKTMYGKSTETMGCFPKIWIALIGRAWCLVEDVALLKAALPACVVIQGKGTNL